MPHRLGNGFSRRDRPIRTGRRDKPIIQLPSIALRVAVVVGIAGVMLAIVLFRLWFLQILSGQEYIAEANDNRLESVKIAAARGVITDRHGKTIVDNRAGIAVGIRLMDVPDGELESVITRLARELGMRPQAIRKRIKDYLRPSTLELQPDGKTWKSYLTWDKVVKGEITGLDLITIKQDVGKRVYSYLLEHTQQFPGVEVEENYLRDYPHGDLAAHVLGYVGEISAEQLKQKHFKGYESGDIVGVTGLEWTYDKWLRGRDGVAKIEVDASGRPKQSDPVSGGRAAEAGDTLVTTLDAKVQAATEDALAKGIELARLDGQVEANGGAAVVLDADNGEVLGMASYPTYEPKMLVGGLSKKDSKWLWGKSSNLPAFNRAIMEAKAVGSTFKAVDAVAALEEGVITPSTTFYCDGAYIAGLDKHEFKCWALDGHGSLDLVGALTQSCDVYFYNVGNAFYDREGSDLQAWAVRLGMGKLTGIDLPGEAEGRIPTPSWKKKYFKTEIDKIWKPGDSILLSVGQGDMLATPLQLATAYATIANGGTVVTPHLGLKIVDSAGETVRDLSPTTSRKVDISKDTLDVVRRGLYEAANSSSGTSSSVFAGYEKTVAGKTGTAEVWDSGRYVNYAWYASYAPADDPKYVVVVMIEKGGHGGTVAAPATRLIYDSLFNLESKEVTGSTVSD